MSLKIKFSKLQAFIPGTNELKHLIYKLIDTQPVLSVMLCAISNFFLFLPPCGIDAISHCHQQDGGVGMRRSISMGRSLTHCCLVTIYGDIDLAQVMACCLTAPSHYLNQCLLIISEVLWHSPEGNVTINAQDIYPCYELENYWSKIMATFPRGQWVNTSVTADEALLQRHHHHCPVQQTAT